MRRRQALAFFALASVAPLSACGAGKAVKKISQVVMDPSVQVGDASDQPTMISLHAYASAEMNRNFENEPTPVVVRIFALTSDHRFFGYDFFSIAGDAEATLGVTLLDELDETALNPDSYKALGPYELPKKTRKIGVLAEYQDIDTAVWRASIDVPAAGANERILLLLLEEEVRLVKEES